MACYPDRRNLSSYQPARLDRIFSFLSLSLSLSLPGSSRTWLSLRALALLVSLQESDLLCLNEHTLPSTLLQPKFSICYDHQYIYTSYIFV